MKKIRLFVLSSLILCCVSGLVACDTDGGSSEKESDVDIIQKDEETHYLKFMENNAEILRIVVLKNETYEDLLPYFPTLTQEEGFIKYWDGDYKYTDYTPENQFTVYSSTNLIIGINSYMKRAS